MLAYLSTISFYLISMVIPGGWLSHRAKTREDFMVAGRKLITPALAAVFFWKRATAKTAVISILCGMSATVIREIIRKLINEQPFGFPAIYPALLLSVVTLILISLIEAPSSGTQWEPFYFRVKR